MWDHVLQLRHDVLKEAVLGMQPSAVLVSAAAWFAWKKEEPDFEKFKHRINKTLWSLTNLQDQVLISSYAHYFQIQFRWINPDTMCQNFPQVIT